MLLFATVYYHMLPDAIIRHGPDVIRSIAKGVVTDMIVEGTLSVAVVVASVTAVSAAVSVVV